GLVRSARGRRCRPRRRPVARRARRTSLADRRLAPGGESHGGAGRDGWTRSWADSRMSGMSEVDVLTEAVIPLPVAEVAGYAADPANAPRWDANIAAGEWETAAQ